MRATPKRRATRSAAALAQASPSRETSPARRALPLSQSKPASVQPMVPLRSATTLLGTPALINDCAPMMLRVRPAQLTTTMVCGDGADTQHELGARHVDGGGDRDALVFVERPAVEHDDVAALAHEPRELGGVDARRGARVLDELAERLARDVDAGEQFEPGLGPARNPAVERMEIGVAGAREDVSGALAKAVGGVAQHDARAPPRHQAGEFELEPAQRHRARE